MTRYSRLEAIEGIGAEGLEKLSASNVLVVGCGALGSLCAMYLAGSGVGHLCICDFDTIDISNLQRQLFFTECEAGKSKSRILESRIRALNSDIEVRVEELLITENIAEMLFVDYDFIIDGSDNPATKLTTSRVCERLGKAYCIGGVRGMSGQVASWTPGHLGYAEIFGEVDGCQGILPCSLSGVLGAAAGVVASVQSAEAVKYITGGGELLVDRLLTFDLRTSSFRVLEF